MANYPFGTNKTETAAILRALADKIEGGDILLMNDTRITTAKREDFTTHVVFIKFAEKTADPV